MITSNVSTFPWTRFVTAYRSVAILLLNTVVLMLVINLPLGLLFAWRDASHRATESPARKYQEANLAAVYPDFGRTERNRLLEETWTRPYVYEDYVMFRERPYAGRYVNVSPAGFRHGKNQGPWPPDSRNLNVFVFGGSTTFGYGLPDSQTVPSCLQDALARHFQKRVCIYNFGSGNYYSTQERIRFEKLLADGFVPAVALFIDGLNECEQLDDVPYLSDRFRRAVAEADQTVSLGRWGRRVPLLRAVRFVATRLTPSTDPHQPDWSTSPNRARLERALEKYRKNVALLEGSCRQFGVFGVFVWQPMPGFLYDLRHHLFADRPRFKRQELFGAATQASVARNPSNSNFIWCGDLQRDARECLYVDSVHYTAKFSRAFAEAIVERCQARGLLQQWLTQ
jgi:hypothetical protein